MWLNRRVMFGLLSSQKGQSRLKLSSRRCTETRTMYMSCSEWWCRSAGAWSCCAALKDGIIYIPHAQQENTFRFEIYCVFTEMCFGAVFNIIFHMFFIAIGAFGHLYSQKDTENPSELPLMHLNHFNYLFWVRFFFFKSKFDNWLCKLFYISPFSSVLGVKLDTNFCSWPCLFLLWWPRVAYTPHLASSTPLSQTSSGKKQWIIAFFLRGETGPWHLKFNLSSSQLPAKCLQNVFLSSFVGASVRLWFLYWHLFICVSMSDISGHSYLDFKATFKCNCAPILLPIRCISVMT